MTKSRVKKSREKTQRNETITKLIHNGASYRDVGDRYGISGKRVFEIARKSGGDKDSKSKRILRARKPRKRVKRLK